MNRKHVLYATSALLLVGGGTLSVIKLTSDSADKTDNAITVESTTEAATTETQTAANKDDKKTDGQSASGKDDRKKDDNKTTVATTEINNNISSEYNDNQTVSSGNSGTTAPSGNGSSSGNGNSSSGNSSSGNGSSGGSTGGGNSSGGNGSSGNGSSGNGSSAGNGSSGGGGNPSGPVAPVHTHDWQPVYKTIHHDEVSHTERVKISDAYDEPVYARGSECHKCGYEWVGGAGVCQVTDDGTHICPNCGTELELTGFASGTIQTGTTHHDAVYEDKKIIDQAAYDEQVIDYYKCSCGETK